VRLCKGAYLEPASAAFPRKSDVDRNFVELMQFLLGPGRLPAIATHDENIIRRTEAYAAGRGNPARCFRVPDALRHPPRPAAPAGVRGVPPAPLRPVWQGLVPYYMRRLAERPANVLFIARNLFRQ